MLVCRATARTGRRIIPFLILMYVLAFVDRANVGFAKAALQADTGIGDSAYAFGAGIFFIGYALFEVPSNLILHRVGARRWLARIMVTWGLVSASMAFVHDARSYYVLRCLLGIAEAGFFPGIILYLTLWFPAAARAQAMGIFYFGLPLALMLGGPVSGALLDVAAPFGLAAWQWMFVVEGLAASLVGVVALFYLPDRPADARWLPADERAALVAALAQEAVVKGRHGPASVARIFTDRRIAGFILIYFAIQVSVYGVVFYLPSRIAALSGEHVGTLVGLLTAIPWSVAIAATFAVTRLADRTCRHRALGGAMLLLAAVGIVASAFAQSIVVALLAFCLATSGFVAAQPLFWTLPTGYLGGAVAAACIGLINAVGNLGGFVAPTLKDAIERATGQPEIAMCALGAVAAGGALCLFLLKDRKTA